MKTIHLLLTAVALGLALPACDSPRENAVENAGEQKADALENKADAVRANAEQKADAIEEKADQVEEATDR